MSKITSKAQNHLEFTFCLRYNIYDIVNKKETHYAETVYELLQAA